MKKNLIVIFSLFVSSQAFSWCSSSDTPARGFVLNYKNSSSQYCVYTGDASAVTSFPHGGIRDGFKIPKNVYIKPSESLTVMEAGDCHGSSTTGVEAQVIPYFLTKYDGETDKCETVFAMSKRLGPDKAWEASAHIAVVWSGNNIYEFNIGHPLPAHVGYTSLPPTTGSGSYNVTLTLETKD